MVTIAKGAIRPLRIPCIRFVLIAFALVLSVARADYGIVSSDAPPPSALPAITEGLGFDQRLNQDVPLDATFKDEHGAPVTLRQYVGQRPMVLALAYYKCPNVCTVVIREAFQTLQQVRFGRDDAYSFVVLSIDPSEGPDLADPKLRAYLKSYPAMESQGYTHFLTGSEDQIKKVAAAIGFKYRWDDRAEQFIHPSGLTVVTPAGKISRYLMGVTYDPKDMRLALVEASAGKIGTLVDKVTLFCYRYDPASGKYGFVIMRGLRIFGGLTVTALGGLIFTSLRRERRKKKQPGRDEEKGSRKV